MHGDDCEPNPGAWDDSDYGLPISYYRDQPPAGYNLVRQRNWLIEHRRRAYHALALMQARRDWPAVQRISNVIHMLDLRIARDDRLLAGDPYPSPRAPYYPSEPGPKYHDPGQPNPNYTNYGYNQGYGHNPSYGYNPNSPASPPLNGLTSLVGPLLGLPSR
jgi:hypothetical protein